MALITLDLERLVGWIEYAIQAIDTVQNEFSCSDEDDDHYEEAKRIGEFYKSRFSQGGNFEVI